MKYMQTAGEFQSPPNSFYNHNYIHLVCDFHTLRALHKSFCQQRDRAVASRHNIKGKKDNWPHFLTVLPHDSAHVRVTVIMHMENMEVESWRYSQAEADSMKCHILLSRLFHKSESSSDFHRTEMSVVLKPGRELAYSSHGFPWEIPMAVTDLWVN